MLNQQFNKLIEYLEKACSLDSFNDVKNDYEKALVIIKSWLKNYKENNNFNNISKEESYDLHEKLLLIKDDKIGNKNYGSDVMIADDILISYEAVIYLINKEIKNKK